MSMGKMTEVSRSLKNVYRLSSVTNGLRRPAPLSLGCHFGLENSGTGTRKTKGTAARDKYYKVRKSLNRYGEELFLCQTCLTPDWSVLELDYRSGSTQGRKAALQFVLLNGGWGCPGVMSSLKSVQQQRRSFCTVHFILSEGQRLAQTHGRPRWHHCDPSQPARSYSRGQDRFLLYRNKTAYYDILRVSPNATQAQIKTAYYKQSFIYHPDKNPDKDATQHFSQISEAYIVLGNTSLRRRYDRGILSQLDIQNAGKPSSKDASRKTAEAPSQQQQQRVRVSQFGGKPMFDFDAFYQAHYGEQLQKEQEWRARQQRLKERKKDDNFNFQRWMGMQVGVCFIGLVILINLIQ